tara:strand:+ start:10700 stop:11281 length:582 start_codon:yes stop_codon:yes gene_type:complete
MLLEKFKNNHIILASGSPRRQELFKELGLNFTINVKEIDEIYPSTLKEEEITNYLAKLKAKAFENELQENDIIITSDTIVWHNNRPLEKPKNKAQAIAMLQELSGNSHKVITSVCIKTIKSQTVFFDVTTVFFKKLTVDEILFYVENYRPFDKAGGYGIQEWIGFIGVSRIEGSYFNVMGFPVHKVYENLMNL